MLEIKVNESENAAKIIVIGVGGAGNNVVNRMVESGTQGVEFIAVVMRCESIDRRNEDAKTLLNYAFANFSVCRLRPEGELPAVPVELGKRQKVGTQYGGADDPDFGRKFICVEGGNIYRDIWLNIAGGKVAPTGIFR